MLLDQCAILALETAKYWKGVVSPLLIWTLPVQCRNCLGLFKLVLVSYVLALYSDFKL